MLAESSNSAHVSPFTGGEWYMRNDVDLVRKILESVRDRNDLTHQAVNIEGYDELVVARHVERLLRDGLLDGIESRLVSKQVADVLVRDLTSPGHEFLGALESGDVWERLKTALNPKELGALSISELAGVAKELALKGIKKKLGLDD